jgi:hypothetical protein
MFVFSFTYSKYLTLPFLQRAVYPVLPPALLCTKQLHDETAIPTKIKRGNEGLADYDVRPQLLLPVIVGD